MNELPVDESIAPEPGEPEPGEPVPTSDAFDPIPEGVPLRLSTGSRLHFGLLDTAAPFGGVGVMIDYPATEITIEPSAAFRCDSESALRVLAVARRVSDHFALPSLPPCDVKIIARPPAHSGLGSGTQLALAVAEGLCRFVGQEIEPQRLARDIAGRGERSAVGIHGYFHGGLIFESPDRDRHQRCDLNPVRRRIELPPEWCVAVFRTKQTIALVSGNTEREQFSRLAQTDPKQRDELLSLLQQQMMPAAKASDLESFASAVSRYNHASGLLFESVQGGAYNGKEISNLVQALIERGAQGVGQSSWGPSVFAWFDSVHRANEFIRDLPFGFAECSVATPRNSGRSVHAVS